MLSKTIWINIVLAGLVLFFALKARDVWTRAGAPIPKGSGSVSGQSSEPGIQITPQKTIPGSAYRAVVDKNLFSPTRKEIVQEKPVEEEEEVRQLSVSGRKITVHGIILMGNNRTALISNPINRADVQKEIWVKPGDRWGDLHVAEINRESIRMRKGQKTYEVPLYDTNKQKRAEMPKAEKAPTVIMTRPDSKPVKKKPAVSKPAPASGDEYETVSTPFGDFKRKKKN